jgi:hypothetical protein
VVQFQTDPLPKIDAWKSLCYLLPFARPDPAQYGSHHEVQPLQLPLERGDRDTLRFDSL